MRSLIRSDDLAGFLRDDVKKEGYVDIGVRSEIKYCVSRFMLLKAVDILKKENHKLVRVKIPRAKAPWQVSYTYLLCLDEKAAIDAFDKIQEEKE